MITTVGSRLMLTRDARLQISEQVVTRRVGDETVLLNLESGIYFGLDPVGSRFFELLVAFVTRMRRAFDMTET